MKTYIVSIIILLSFSFPSMIKAQTNTTQTSEKLEYMFDGTILSKKGQTITLTISNQRALPVAGQSGILAKYFEENILGMKTTGWLDIGEMKVVSVNIGTVVLSLEKELSVVTKNGEKVDHFKPGTLVHFTWTK